jgi:hypothetical protein
MNNPVILTAIGFLLTALAFGIYFRWRKSPRGLSSIAKLLAFFNNLKRSAFTPAGPNGTSGLPAGDAILAGEIRRPIDEIKQMFGAWILLGISLAVLSLILRSVIPEESRRWIAFPFLILGLAMAVSGSFLGERLDHASRVERIVGFLAYRLGMDLIQITCLAGGAVFLLLAATAGAICGWEAARIVIVVSLALGIILEVIGIFRPRISRLLFRKAGPEPLQVEDRKPEVKVRKGKVKGKSKRSKTRRRKL